MLPFVIYFNILGCFCCFGLYAASVITLLYFVRFAVQSSLGSLSSMRRIVWVAALVLCTLFGCTGNNSNSSSQNNNSSFICNPTIEFNLQNK